MDVERVQRVADFMRHTGSKQRECLEPFALDRFKGLLSSLGRIVNDERHTSRASAFTVERCGIKPKEAGPWKIDFKFMSDPARNSRRIETGDLVPIEIGDYLSDWLALDARLDTEQTSNGLIKIEDPPVFVGYEHAIFNCIEERFQERSFPSEALNHCLEPFSVNPTEPAQDFIEEIG